MRLEASAPPARNPSGASSGSERVSRGVSWINYAVSCRSANRCCNLPDYADDRYGFRVAPSCRPKYRVLQYSRNDIAIQARPRQH